MLFDRQMRAYRRLDGRQPAPCGWWQRAAVEGGIRCAWLLLEVANIVLHVVAWPARCVRKEATKHVVVVGASFGGLAVQRELSGRRDVKVTLVDFKDYFEYTPGVLRCLVDPSWLKELTVPLPSSRNELIVAAMTGATAEAVTLTSADGAVRELPFDYLVLAIGSTYASPIKPVATEGSLAARRATLTAAADRLRVAEKVVVVGAGAVGMELVGEIVTAYPHKQVAAADASHTILPGFDDTARAYARDWCERACVEFLFGEAIAAIDDTRITLRSGPTIAADAAYKCVGVVPNTVLQGTPFEGRASAAPSTPTTGCRSKAMRTSTAWAT